MRHDLEQLEQRWELALQSAGFGVWDLRPPLDQVHYSPEWKASLGYEPSREADSTARWRARVHPDDLQPMLDALDAHLGGHRPAYEIEFRMRAADGSFRWVMSRGRVVERDDAGKALRMVGTLTDLTERRAAEALRAERDAAQASLRAKTQFLSRMSHELRTPLNAVLGFAQLLAAGLEGSGNEAQRRHAGHIEKAGWQLLALIDDVLELSDVESGQIRLAAQPVDLQPLLRSLLDKAEPVAQRRRIALRLDACPDAWVVGDPVQLGRVFEKLLENAVRYNVDGGTVVVRIGAAADTRTVAVQDSGVGIPTAQLPHLFESFNRLGRSGSSNERLGVGLALTRSLVDTMGGKIEVTSRPGAGSTFSVTLPAPCPAGAGGAGEGNPLLV